MGNFSSPLLLCVVFRPMEYGIHSAKDIYANSNKAMSSSVLSYFWGKMRSFPSWFRIIKYEICVWRAVYIRTASSTINCLAIRLYNTNAASRFADAVTAVFQIIIHVVYVTFEAIEHGILRSKNTDD